MTLREIEKYILSEPNAVKTMIPRWQYIRYTVYSVSFATLATTAKGPVLTVLGRFPQYEKEFAKIVVPSVNNDPRFFSSILLRESIPDRVIKSVIDYSYKRRVQAIPMPENAGNGGNIPYCGIMSAVKKGSMPYDANDAAFETAATSRAHRYGIVETMSPPKTELEGRGAWDTLPYVAATDAAAVERFLHTAKDKKDKEDVDRS